MWIVQGKIFVDLTIVLIDERKYRVIFPKLGGDILGIGNKTVQGGKSSLWCN